jgi:hypothetical protein
MHTVLFRITACIPMILFNGPVVLPARRAPPFPV